MLDEIFDRAVRLHGTRVAIDVPPGRARPERVCTTYAALDAAADGLARALAPHLGDDDEPLVAIVLPREAPALYAAQLAALRLGAAFTGLDPGQPDAHLRSVLDAARPAAVVAGAADAARVAALSAAPVVAAPSATAVAAAVREPFAPPIARRGPRDPARLAYVIHTSGTTGAPKGVMIEHRSIVNLVESDVERFGLGPDDRVAQCSSPAYDSSLEETWLALAVGATLVPIDDETVRLGPDLVPWLRAERITVLCPPPTLLRATACAAPATALPDLRLLYVGGEALPPDLADRWAAGRWMENGYGPTECTVTVVRGRVHPGRPVVIGRPVRGNRALVLDETGAETTDGAPGELCISGTSVARGYRGRPDLTAERFVMHPAHGRIYRTGDLVRRTADGDLEFLGRIDAQVKLRGHRLELGAVETHLAVLPGVRAAACRVQGRGGRDLLVAHLVPDDPAAPPALDDLRARLVAALPAVMVPARMAWCDALPTTVGGKLDRAALPEIALAGDARAAPIVPPADALEAAIAAAFARAVGHDGAVSADADFFTELGGDSLSVVAAVCTLRGEAALGALAARDVYEAPTAQALAARLRERAEAPAEAPRGSDASAARAVRAEPGGAAALGRPAACTIAQAAWIAGELAIGSGVAWVVVFVVLPWALGAFGAAGTLALAVALAVLAGPIRLVVAVALARGAHRILLRRTPVGRHPAWGSVALRLWIVRRLARRVPWAALEETALLGVVLRALGARVGRRLQVERGVDLSSGAWDLLELGDDVTLARDAALRVVMLDAGGLVAGPVRLGHGATVHVRAGVGPGAALGDGAELMPLSWLPGGAVLDAGARGDGVPAQAVGRAPAVPVRDPDADARALPPFVHAAAVFAARSALGACPWLGAFAVLAAIALAVPSSAERVRTWLAEPVLAPGPLAAAAGVACASLVLGLVVLAGLVRLVGPVRPGTVAARSRRAVLTTLKIGAVDAAGRWLSGALFWPLWLRLAGMRVGRGSEISTIIEPVPELVEIGAGSFFADGIYLAPPVRRGGLLVLARTRLGRDTFLGNHALLPAGHDWPDELFVGVATVPDPARATAGSAWFGHPPLPLPRRAVATVDRRLTHEPSLVRRVNRVLWESARLALPAAPVVLAAAWCRITAATTPALGALGASVVATLATGAAAVASIVLLKWAFLGRVRPGEHPLWSCWCSRWDFLYVAWGEVARPVLETLEGTLLLNAVLRAFGVRVGRRVRLGAGFAQVVDPDMLRFDDDATVVGQFQAHTFEDRVLKIDHVTVGPRATLGPEAVAFYGVVVGEAAHVAPHAVVMKREVVPTGATFDGAPAAPSLDPGGAAD